MLDTNHAEIGGLVGQHWQLPARVVSGITHHHTPSQGDDLVCDVVHVANEIAKRVSDDAAPVSLPSARPPSSVSDSATPMSSSHPRPYAVASAKSLPRTHET
ncbi:MAG TPA: HDOD domain-containing protein [Acidobacteria bacterium]|nr:HDOD domain-containing protein [Acidobacteriota bacterium]